VQLLADSDFTVGIDAVDLEPVFGEIKTDPAWRAAPLIVASHTTTFWHIDAGSGGVRLINAFAL